MIMKFMRFMAFMVILTGCHAMFMEPVQDVYTIQKTLARRFVYISDEYKFGVPERWETGVTGDGLFSGDCEEFALAGVVQMSRIQPEQWHVQVVRQRRRNEHHALACGDGKCFDNGGVYTEKEARRRFVFEGDQYALWQLGKSAPH